MITRWRSMPPVVQDVVVGMVFAFLWFAAFRYWTNNGTWRPVYPETYHVAGFFSAVALATRRIAPKALLVATTILYPLTYTAVSANAVLQTEFHLLPILIAGYGASVSGKVRPVIAAVASMASIILISASTYGIGAALAGYPDRSRTLFHLFAATGFVALGVLVRQQRETAEALAEQNLELERMREVEAARAVADERTRIARELHDVVAHHLVALIVRGQAAVRVSEDRPEEASRSLQWMISTARDALNATRQTVRVLRSDTDDLLLAPEPTISDLGSIVDRVNDAGLEVTFLVDEALPPLDPQTELAAVRIAQEALTNALRHANANRAVVSLRGTGDGLCLQIEDDGEGHVGDLSATQGHGVLGMHERAASCGGTLEIDSGPLGGWRVKAVLPSAKTVQPA